VIKITLNKEEVRILAKIYAGLFIDNQVECGKLTPEMYDKLTKTDFSSELIKDPSFINKLSSGINDYILKNSRQIAEDTLYWSDPCDTLGKLEAEIAEDYENLSLLESENEVIAVDHAKKLLKSKGYNVTKKRKQNVRAK